MKKSFYLPLLFLLSPLISQASSPFSGFIWIGNTAGTGVEMNDPSALAIKTDGLTLENGKILGSVEIGGAKSSFVLKSQINPISSLNGVRTGYLKFNEGTPSNDCFGAGDCYPAKWTSKTTSLSQLEGFISGWAKMEIGAPGKYPDVWVHFRSPSDPDNYVCPDTGSARNENYFVCSDQSGKFYGFAWSSGAISTSLADNPGLGFLDFSQVSFTAGFVPQPIDLTTNSNEQEILSQAKPADPKTCSIDFLDGITKSKTICEANDKVLYKASASFTDINTYTWQCDGETPQEDTSPSHECVGEKPPTLTIFTKDDEEDIVCASSTKVVIDSTPTCQVEARESGSDALFSKSLSLFTGAKIETRITGKCLEKTTTTWDKTNLNLTESNNKSLQALAVTGGEASILASIKTEKGDKIDCGKVDIKVKEKMKWGN